MRFSDAGYYRHRGGVKLKAWLVGCGAGVGPASLGWSKAAPKRRTPREWRRGVSCPVIPDLSPVVTRLLPRSGLIAYLWRMKNSKVSCGSRPILLSFAVLALASAARGQSVADNGWPNYG